MVSFLATHYPTFAVTVILTNILDSPAVHLLHPVGERIKRDVREFCAAAGGVKSIPKERHGQF